MDSVKIQVRFTKTATVNGKEYEFKDALYFTPEQYASLTPEELNALKEERVANFVSLLENPPEPVEPTVGQMKAELAAIPPQINVLEERKVELTSKIAEAEE